MRQSDTGFLLETTRPLSLSKKIIYILVRARTSPKIVRWAFLFFVLTIPFEFLDLKAIGASSSLARIVGLFFFSACLFYPKVCFRRPQQALLWFAGYASIAGLSGLLIPAQFVDPFLVQLQTLIQLLFLCWIGSTLLQEEKFARHTVLTLSIATLLSAVGMLLGLPGFSATWRGGRLSSSMDSNPNGLAIVLALGAQALIGLGIDKVDRKMLMRVTLMALSLFPLTAMIYTGSRGGIMAYVAGTVLYALPYRKSKRKLTAILGVAIAIVGLIYVVANDETVLLRFEKTYGGGDTAGRDRIFTASIEMISEKPLLGWLPVVWSYELGPREGKGNQFRDAHNLFLHLLLEVGLLGAIPFFIGLGLCVRAAWTARGCSLGLLPLVWLATMMVGSMSGTFLRSKSLWLVLTLSLASGASTIQSERRNLMIKTVL